MTDLLVPNSTTHAVDKTKIFKEANVDTMNVEDLLNSTCFQNIDDTELIEEEHEKVCRMGFKNYIMALSIFCDQPSHIPHMYPIFSSYTIDVEEAEPKRHDYIDGSDVEGGDYQMMIYAANKTIYFQPYPPSVICGLIDFNDNRFLFLPLIITKGLMKGSAHAISMIIDKKLREIYLFDPNGRTTYFNDIMLRYYMDKGIELPPDIQQEMVIDTTFKINDMMSMYVEDINKSMTDSNKHYRFVDYSTWNPNLSVINQTFEDELNGFCVTLNLMVCRLMNTTNNSIYNVYDTIAKMNQKEFRRYLSKFSKDLFNALNLRERMILYHNDKGEVCVKHI